MSGLVRLSWKKTSNFQTDSFSASSSFSYLILMRKKYGIDNFNFSWVGEEASLRNTSISKNPLRARKFDLGFCSSVRPRLHELKNGHFSALKRRSSLHTAQNQRNKRATFQLHVNAALLIMVIVDWLNVARGGFLSLPWPVFGSGLFLVGLSFNDSLPGFEQFWRPRESFHCPRSHRQSSEHP